MARGIRAVLVAFAFLSSHAFAATHVWISQDGNFGAASSWSTNKAPSEWFPTDSVLFSGTVQTNATTGLNQPGVRVASFFVHDQYFGDIGSSGSPLVIAADVFTFRGIGALSYKAMPTPGKMNFAFIDTVSTGNLIWGSHDYLIIRCGYFTIQPSAAIQKLLVDGCPTNPYFSPSIVAEAGDSIPYIVAAGGFFDNYRPISAGSVLKIERSDFLQIGIMETGAQLQVEGGRFTYQPIDTPPIPGPTAEFEYGTADFQQTFYDVHFAFAIKSYWADVLANQPLSFLGILDVDTNTPSVSFLDRGDSDADGVFNVFDACPETPNFAPDPCGGLTLSDFAAFQNAMTGP